MYDILGGHVFHLSDGAGGLVSLELGVRAVIAPRPCWMLLAGLFGAPVPQVCLSLDPLGYRIVGVSVAYLPV